MSPLIADCCQSESLGHLTGGELGPVRGLGSVLHGARGKGCTSEGFNEPECLETRESWHTLMGNCQIHSLGASCMPLPSLPVYAVVAQ